MNSEKKNNNKSGTAKPFQLNHPGRRFKGHILKPREEKPSGF
jgi:hypothetical protein